MNTLPQLNTRRTMPSVRPLLPLGIALAIASVGPHAAHANQGSRATVVRVDLSE